MYLLVNPTPLFREITGWENLGQEVCEGRYPSHPYIYCSATLWLSRESWNLPCKVWFLWYTGGIVGASEKAFRLSSIAFTARLDTPGRNTGKDRF